jgi:RND family efflux transporter MFP subunit
MPDKQDFTFGPTVIEKPAVLRYVPPKRLKTIAIIAAGVALCIVIAGLLTRMVSARTVDEWTQDQAVPIVKTIAPSGARAGNGLVLPGAAQALNSAPIYAQVSGYVQKWFVDIGTPVKVGQLLAQIDPRTYQAALDQAKGALARDAANLANAKVDLGRYQALAAQNAISSQQVATQQSTVNADAGVVQADQAQVEQASINLGYTRIIAPFDGIVTSRSIDIGNFVAVGNASSTPLFTVADESRLRVYVRVPQGYSADIQPGTSASFKVPEYPDRTFTATADASAGAVDPASGTVLVQLITDNSQHLLKPGAYAEVHFNLHTNAVAVQVPSSALMFRNSGMAVATVGRNGTVAIKNVTIARDLGTSVEISSGVSPSDRIIDNPPDSIRPGDMVRVANALPRAGKSRTKTAEE